MQQINNLMNEMISYYSNDPKRIQHFIKVYTFSKLIGEMEKIDEDTQFILISAALVHDIGIKKAEELYGCSIGKYQEKLGPDIAKDMLSRLSYTDSQIDRICYLIGHHHTYSNIDGIDYQILVEADFLVNIYEDDLTKDSAITALNKIFKTSSGISILKTMFID